MAGCNKGFEGCPGKVPLNSKQCKSHRFYARMKSKMETSKGEGEDNSWISAVDNMKNVRQNNQCVKECCRVGLLQFHEVTKEIA